MEFIHVLNRKAIHFVSLFLFAASFSTVNPVQAKDAVSTIKATSIALRGQPKYPADFKHWDYVNPNAPQGGQMVLATQGTFDNFNRFAMRGSSPTGIEGLFDSLMVGNDDEIEVYYGLIAKEIEYPSDFSWIKFYLNDKATFQDGKKIKASDVVFSFNTFMKDGVPAYRKINEGVEAVAESDSVVKFVLPRADKNLMLGLVSLKVLPEHYYKDKAFSEPFKTPPLGSGPYVVADYEMGKYITYERKKDYWARNHPTMLGTLNFDKYRIDYYLDETVLMEAFKKGEYDFRTENISKNWATQYTGEAFDKGYIVKEQIPHQLPSGNQAFVFNVQKPQFKDRRVRQALNLLFDFEWTNKNLFYGSYSRNFSHFMNTQYASSGLPQGEELEILQQYKGKIPDELFSKPFALNKTDGSGNIRREMRQALSLFKQAGYTTKDNKLVDANGKQFEFEILLYSASMERIVIPFKKNVERIGAKMNIRLVSDASQYINRLREREFEMVVSHMARGGFPGEILRLEWHSNYLDSTYNAVGALNPVVDELVEKIMQYQQDDEKLVPYAKALDRILLWEYYTIPQWHVSEYRVAYWNKFSRPKTLPKYDLGESTWWYDETKAKKLPQKKQ